MPRQGLYVDCWFGRLHNIEFRNNEAYNCMWGMGISAEGEKSSMDSIFIHHNLLYDNGGSGVLFSGWGENEIREHIYIYNNTIVNSGSANHWGGLTGGIDVRSANIRNVFIYNNISAYNYGFAIGSSVKPDERESFFKERNVIITNNLEWQVNVPGREKSDNVAFPQVFSLVGRSAVIADPKFTDIKGKNFLPSAGSAAWNNGWKGAPKGVISYIGAISR
jgi:hypothetical protein